MRLVSAGIPRAIAQRWLLACALAAVLALGAAAPSLAAVPVDPAGAVSGAVAAVPEPAAAAAGALPAGAAQPVQRASGAVGKAAQAAQRAGEAPQRAVEAPRAPARRAVEALAPRAEATSADPVAAVHGATGRAGPPPTPADAPAKGAPPAAGDGRSVKPAALDGVARLLGDTLRTLVPVDSLVEPVAPLLAGLGLGDLTTPALGSLLSPRRGPAPARMPTATRPFGAGGPLGADALEARSAGAHAAPPAGLPSFQSASTQPPAAEAGGRPGSPSPRKAPAPAAGGAAASAPAGSLFVPFLSLLVLAALAGPKLLRRFDAAPAVLRPAPFVCALERPG